jgi:hypothetical protein
MKDYEAFVYCWTDTKRNMLYVGKHKGNINDGYICSSKYFLCEYKKRPHDFIRTIIATGIDTDMISLETFILTSENARLSEEYYNMHNNNGKGTFTLKGHTDKTKRKISEANIGRPKLKARGARPNFAGKNNHFYGKKHSDEARIKMSGKRSSIAGDKNHKAKSVIIDSTFYSTMKEASEKTGISLYKIRIMISKGEIGVI